MIRANRAPSLSSSNGHAVKPGRLNSFQRMMLNWEDVRAFNAVHVARLDHRISPAEIESGVLQTLAQLGISSIEFDADRRRYEYFPDGPTPQFRVVEPSGDARADLSAEIASQLNRPFSDSRHSPFRFFYLPLPSGCYLGMAYHHVIGDAASVSLVMQRLLQQLVDGCQVPPEPIDLYPPTLATKFSKELSARRLPAVLTEFASDLIGYRKCHVLSIGDQRNARVGFKIIDTNLPTRELLATARYFGAKVQDLAFAALFEAIGSLIPYEQRARSRRPHLALTAAVDLRRHTHGELANSLGQFLSCFAVKHPLREATSFGQLVKEVEQQTSQIKRRKTYFAQAAMHGVMNALWPLLPRSAKIQPLRYVCPFVGTISNMDLTRRLSALPVSDYLRAASTGPVMPLILDITTLGNTFNLTLMYRESAFQESQIDEIGKHLRRRLVEFHSAGREATEVEAVL